MPNLTKKEKEKKKAGKFRTRDEYTKEITEYHKDVLNMIEGDYLFIPKFAYYRKGSTAKDGKVVQFFENELDKNIDIYIERIDSNGEPEDPDRTLFRLRPNPFFREEYESEDKQSKKGNDYTVFLVPFEEFEIVKIKEDNNQIEQSTATTKVVEETGAVIVTPNNGAVSWNSLNARDRACIELKVPESDKQWLNELIKKAN